MAVAGSDGASPSRNHARPFNSRCGLLVRRGTCAGGRRRRRRPTTPANRMPIQADTIPVYLVKPGKLRFTVVERAIVEPCWVVREYCRLKGSTTISWILPEGATVMAGQPICQLVTKNESGLIFASLSGILIHPPDFDRPDGQPIDEFGATVRNGQEIFTIVDDHGPTQLDVKVHERGIDQIERGLKARIKFDAFPNALLTGTVSEVAVLPDPIFSSMAGSKPTRQKSRSLVRRPACARHDGRGRDPHQRSRNVLSVPVEAVVIARRQGAQLRSSNPLAGSYGAK